MKNIIILLLSSLFSLFLVIGTSFKFYNSFYLISKNIFISILIFILMMFIFYKLIFWLYKLFDNYKGLNDIKFFNFFNDKPFLTSFIIIVLCWFIYVIAFYPCILSPDPSHQILQYFGIDNKYSYYSVLIDKNMIITNHHPVVHTLLIGLCMKIGMFFGSVNVGLFLYSVIQILVLSLTLAYTIYFMKKLGVSGVYRLGCLLIYVLVPVFPFYAMSPVKDVIFGCLIILYIIVITNYIIFKDKINLFKGIKFFLLIILIILFRNNGIYVVLLSMPFLFLICHQESKKILIIFISVLVFYSAYQNVILPYFKVTPSSIREVLSIPFQQTARYVTLHENNVSSDEKKAIDKVLGYDTLASRYNPEKADAVKNGFNRYSTKDDLINYFKAWFTCFSKEPLTYISATINNTYGYFYPFDKKWYIYYKYNDVLKSNGFNYHYNNLDGLREVLIKYGKMFQGIPILGLCVNIGFSTWCLFLMIGYLIYMKKYREIIIYLPAFIILLVCIASPVNTYFRYALPIVFGMPLMIGIFLGVIKKVGVSDEK